MMFGATHVQPPSPPILSFDVKRRHIGDMASSLRSLIAVFGGYLVIVVLTSLTFHHLGILSPHSPLKSIVLGTAGSIGSGFVGGATAALVARKRRFLHAAGVLIFLAIDTAYVLTHFPGPWWFDVGGASILMIATLGGGGWVEKRSPQT